jgi:hypothetical protein
MRFQKVNGAIWKQVVYKLFQVRSCMYSLEIYSFLALFTVPLTYVAFPYLYYIFDIIMYLTKPTIHFLSFLSSFSMYLLLFFLLFWLLFYIVYTYIILSLLFLLLFSFSEVCTRFGKMVNGLIFT